MKNDELDKWGLSILKGTENLWEKMYKYEPGFSVFYTPLKYEPELMILGMNPGGSEKDFDLTKARLIPKDHDYFITYPDPYRLAEKMNNVFKNIGKMPLLKNSVKLNVNFFRSKNQEGWNKINPELRKEAESFCKDKVKEIIEKLKPRTILAEGIGSHEIIKKNLGIEKLSDELVSSPESKQALFIETVDSPIPLYGIAHPTGARGVFEKDWNLIESSLKKRLG